MYQFAGGKPDESGVSVTDFLPGWWEVKEGEEAGDDRETLMAKFARTFAGFGGKPSGS